MTTAMGVTMGGDLEPWCYGSSGSTQPWTNRSRAQAELKCKQTPFICDGTRSDVTLKATFAKKKKTYKLLWSLISFVCFTLFFNGK